MIIKTECEVNINLDSHWKEVKQYMLNNPDKLYSLLCSAAKNLPKAVKMPKDTLCQSIDTELLRAMFSIESGLVSVECKDNKIQGIVLESEKFIFAVSFEADAGEFIKERNNDRYYISNFLPIFPSKEKTNICMLGDSIYYERGEHFYNFLKQELDPNLDPEIRRDLTPIETTVPITRVQNNSECIQGCNVLGVIEDHGKYCEEFPGDELNFRDYFEDGTFTVYKTEYGTTEIQFTNGRYVMRLLA